MRRRRKKYYAKTNQEKTWNDYINFKKTHFRMKKIIKDKEGRYRMIKGPIFQEDITILNGYASNDKYEICESKPDITQGEVDKIY